MMDFSWLREPTLLIPVVGVLGLLVGSFLNVVILRLPKRLEHDWQAQAREFLGQPAPADDTTPPDLVFKGSHCTRCKHALSALDKIPLLSFLALRGRCRYCRTPISWHSPPKCRHASPCANSCTSFVSPTTSHRSNRFDNEKNSAAAGSCR